ncbi:MAG: hypothetical protein AB8I08_01665 [Sandaracinaceae bacterium]
MAIKRHRLLHTLVFSSVLAAGGCGAATPAPLEPVAAARPVSVEPAADAPEYEPVAYASQTDADRDAEGEGRTEASPASTVERYCEPGWPTTKGASLRCETTPDPEGAMRTVCCDRLYPSDPDFGTDPAQCCVQGS